MEKIYTVLLASLVFCPLCKIDSVEEWLWRNKRINDRQRFIYEYTMCCLVISVLLIIIDNI